MWIACRVVQTSRWQKSVERGFFGVQFYRVVRHLRAGPIDGQMATLPLYLLSDTTGPGLSTLHPQLIFLSTFAHVPRQVPIFFSSSLNIDVRNPSNLVLGAAARSAVSATTSESTSYVDWIGDRCTYSKRDDILVTTMSSDSIRRYQFRVLILKRRASGEDPSMGTSKFRTMP